MSLTLDRFSNLVWYWATRNAEPQDIEKFRIQLWRPPKGVVPTRGPWSAEAETNAFRTLKAALTGAKSPPAVS